MQVSSVSICDHIHFLSDFYTVQQVLQYVTNNSDGLDIKFTHHDLKSRFNHSCSPNTSLILCLFAFKRCFSDATWCMHASE